MKYNVELSEFEGPLDLLLHLITKNEIDIYDIPISEITNQYMEYIKKIEGSNMELASEFLVMAATLIEIKSKLLLPDYKNDIDEYEYDENDPRKQLVEKLIEYKKYKMASEILKSKEGTLSTTVFKEQSEISDFVKEMTIEELNQNLEVQLLIEAVKNLSLKLDRFDKMREGFFDKVKRDNFTVESKIEFLREKLKNINFLEFKDLFTNITTKEEVIVSFLAILELLKLKEIKIRQGTNFDDILIDRFCEVE